MIQIVSAIVLSFSVYGFCLESANLEPFTLVSKAPPRIQKAAQSVVRIKTLDSTGTGFFVGPQGLLITNSHVVGPDNCSREGCYLTLNWDYQHGKKSRTQEVFAVPQAHSSKLDIVILHLFRAPENGTLGEAWSPTEKLPLGYAAATRQDELYVVGHPFGGLKRWTTGKIFRKQGDWQESTHCSAPGNSGSPVLNAAGEVVGIVHRASELNEWQLADLTRLMHFTDFSMAHEIYQLIHLDVSALQESLEPFFSLPLSGRLKADPDLTFEISIAPLAARHQWSIELEETKTKQPLLDLSYALCEAEVEEGWDSLDPEYEFAECSLSRHIIDCQSTNPDRCPSTRGAWKLLFEKIAAYKKLNSQEDALDWHLASIELFSHTEQEVETRGYKKLISLLDSSQGEFDFLLAPYLATYASNKEQMKYDGQDYLNATLHYGNYPFYTYHYQFIEGALEELTDSGFIDAAELKAAYFRLINDPRSPVAVRAAAEAAAYEADFLDVKLP